MYNASIMNQPLSSFSHLESGQSTREDVNLCGEAEMHGRLPMNHPHFCSDKALP